MMSSTALPDDSPSLPELAGIGRLGLIAGEGDFPFLIARAARDRGLAVTAFGVKGVTPPGLADEADAMHWIEMGQFQRLINLFHEAGVTDLVMAGRIRHNSIFQYAKFDLRGLKMMARLVNKKADTILTAVTHELEHEGIRVLDSTLFLRGLMPPKGLLTPNARISPDLQKDIDFGYELAKQVAGLDIGQTVVVKSQSIVAVEAMEGTDQTIERAGAIAGPGVVVVKVSKPRQDKRFDVPVMGLRTVQKLAEARGAALAFSGGEALFFDQPRAVELAEQSGIILVGV